MTVSPVASLWGHRRRLCCHDLGAAAGVERGAASSRTEVGEFEYSAQAVVVTSGGIGGSSQTMTDTVDAAVQLKMH